jgi:methionyl-tRNA formyltransferase
MNDRPLTNIGDSGDASARLGVAGCKSTTLETLMHLRARGRRVDLLVTLSPEQGERHSVAGYYDLTPYALKHGIDLYTARSYSLSDPADQDFLAGAGLACLLVVGWQRLIPEWFLDRLPNGAFGMHGSAEPLPRGRGRSPLNWALAEGRTSFLTHLFRYDAHVDSGAVVGRQRFDITPWDDCETLHFKNRMSMTRLLDQHLGSILDGTVTLVPQDPETEPTYLPKRTDEDGRILWADMNMSRLHNQIRCQTHPFPGAFSHLNGAAERFHFWRGHPFDTHLTDLDTRPGTVVERFYDGSFLVTTWDGSVLVKEVDPDSPEVAVGDRFLDHPK